MAKFRKKPVVIDALQFDGTEDGMRLVNRFVGYSVGFSYKDGSLYLWIDTREGGHTADPHDWIIKGIKGEFYPCKPDIFAATYELVGKGAPAAPTLSDDAREIAAACYQLAGVADAPVRILDALSAAANEGTPLPENFLPILPDEWGAPAAGFTYSDCPCAHCQTWVSEVVSQSAPDDGWKDTRIEKPPRVEGRDNSEQVLVWSRKNDWQVIAHYDHALNRWDDGTWGNEFYSYGTMWHPLPAPPSAKPTEGA